MFQHYTMQIDLYGFGVQCLRTVYNVSHSICISGFMGLLVEFTCGILSLTDISMCIYMSYMLCTRQFYPVLATINVTF